MRSRHRATTGPARHDPDRTRGWALIGLISLAIPGLSSAFVFTTNLTTDLARGPSPSRPCSWPSSRQPGSLSCCSPCSRTAARDQPGHPPDTPASAIVRTDDNPTPKPHCVHARDVIAQLSGIADRVGVGKFEASPSGQWEWIEEETGVPITEAIADELVGAS